MCSMRVFIKSCWYCWTTNGEILQSSGTRRMLGAKTRARLSELIFVTRAMSGWLMRWRNSTRCSRMLKQWGEIFSKIAMSAGKFERASMHASKYSKGISGSASSRNHILRSDAGMFGSAVGIA
eukprot:Amastigsp_a343380_12.p3 type:complete len:123 gc:universal Amastigsp_a343380_12:1023-655(-)